MAAETSLEQEALKRREKLKALRLAAAGAKEDRGEKRELEKDSNNSLPAKVIKFRNYQPKDDSLKEKKLTNAKPLSVEAEVKDHLEKGKSEDVVNEVELTNLAPRKPDWDLKRDVAKKLEKLEKRTQKAIVEIIRTRLQNSEENLAEVVNAGATQHGFNTE